VAKEIINTDVGNYFYFGLCWSNSKTPDDEELTEVDIMKLKITLSENELFLQ
jgi:hypothetical protein